MEDEGGGNREWIQFFKKNGLLYTYNTKHGTIQRRGTLKDAMAAIEKGMKRRNAK
jgi:hypothetical protein